MKSDGPYYYLYTMHSFYDKLYDYTTCITLSNDETFRFRQTGDQQRQLESFLEEMDKSGPEEKDPVFIGFYTESGRFIAVNHARIRLFRFLFDIKGQLPPAGYDDHFGIREIQCRVREELAGDERRHRLNEAEKEGRPGDPMPDDVVEDAEVFMETSDIDLEAELPGIALKPMTIEPDDDIPDVIVYTAYLTDNNYAENDLARNSYFYYDLEPGTLAYFSLELLHLIKQRKYLCLTNENGETDAIPMDTIWLMDISQNMLASYESGEDEFQDEEGDDSNEHGDDDLDWDLDRKFEDRP